MFAICDPIGRLFLVVTDYGKDLLCIPSMYVWLALACLATATGLSVQAGGSGNALTFGNIQGAYIENFPMPELLVTVDLWVKMLPVGEEMSNNGQFANLVRFTRHTMAGYIFLYDVILPGLAGLADFTLGNGDLSRDSLNRCLLFCSGRAARRGCPRCSPMPSLMKQECCCPFTLS